MKYRIFILLVVLCLVFVGCDSAKNDTNATTDPATTTTQPEAPTETPTDGGQFEFTLPEEFQGIQLPEYEFTDEDLEGFEVKPVTEPSETEPDGTEPEVTEPEGTEAPEETTPYIPSNDPDVLPEDILDDDE